ncbi:hypothetical protein PVL29_024084 [Vitis rotundifolia]|uniref:Casein kinase substrate phosphoprotein PP28 domain-containing protein n=1 Tax=Vitis rotundifolia TaxID=103349 RepID=A0AA38YQY7_VITRO|nr:hypothetical protein PVL29_024084 [Vitis rotundifolia]
MGKGKGKGKLKGKSAGMRQFSTDEEIVASNFVHPSTFKQEEIEAEEEYSEEESREERDLDIEKITQLSRHEKNEIDKQKRHERGIKLHEQGKTEQARKDLERLTLIRQQIVDAAKKREEEKAFKEKKKAETRKWP